MTPTLEGPNIRLEPLTPGHFAALEKTALDPVAKPVIWRYMVKWPQTAEDLHAWIQVALDEEAKGTAMPWVTVMKAPNADTADQVIGCTRFFALDPTNKTVELGHTWIAPAFHGTRANTEAKFLQLTYAFEELKLNRVGLKTHHENRRSQAAIKAIGGVYEGTFRNHLIMPDGSQRDSCWFSFIKQDWPDVKDLLRRRLQAPV